MSQPKIMVFHLKELISAMLLFAVGILLILLFVVFLLPRLTGYGQETGTMSDGAEETSYTDTASSAEIFQSSSASSSADTADNSASSGSLTSAGTADTYSGKTSGNSVSASADALYYAGIYTSSYVMNNQTMEIEVILDENHINSIRFVNVDDAVETVSPLLLPAMESVAEQIVNSQSFDDLTAPEGSEYTYQVLIEAIRTTIAKGEVG